MIMTDEGKPSTREEKARQLAELMKRQLGQFCEFLTEAGLVELMLNADGTVWADRLGKGMTRIGTMRRASAESFIGTVVSTLRRTVTRDNPILECALPLEAPFDGSRFEALVPSGRAGAGVHDPARNHGRSWSMSSESPNAGARRVTAQPQCITWATSELASSTFCVHLFAGRTGIGDRA